MKKLLVCLLVLMMVVPMFVACDDDEVGGDESVNITGMNLTTPVIDLGGRDVNILCWDYSIGNDSIKGYTGEIMYSEDNPSSVDVAKKEVATYIQQTYNCKLVGEMISTGSIAETVRTQNLSGTHYYDICFDSLGKAANLALENQILDLKSVEGIDLSKSWWDQNAVADLSIGGKVYFTCGDINTYDDQGTWCILFNKNLKDKLGISEDFYQLVRDDEWTYDKFVEICTGSKTGVKITNESNGDGVLDEKDTWAFGSETYNIYVHAVGAGMKIAQKDDNDLPTLTVSTEAQATYTILGKILEFYNDRSTVMVANASPYLEKFPSPKNPWDETVHKAFTEGRELFYMCGLINVASFRTMDDEFGILPIPKYYETQDRYYHTVSVDNCTVMFLPISIPTNQRAEIGTLVSAIGELSEQKVTPAYYDVQLKYRDAKDDESGEMLDLIFASRTFDLGCAFNWGDILWQYMSMDQAIASRFESILGKAENALEETIEAVNKRK